MSIGNKIISGTVVLGIANIVMRFISFLSVIFVVRALAVYEYGLFTLFMSLAGPVTVFSEMGMGELIVADVSRNLGEKNFTKAKSIMWHFFRLRFVLLIFILIVGFIFRKWLEIKYGSLVVNYFWLFVIFILVQYAKNIYCILLQIHERFTHFSTISIIEGFVKFIFVVVFYSLGKLNIVTLIIAYIAGTITSTVIFTPYVFKMLRYLKNIPLEKERIVYGILRQHGKWQVAFNVANSLTSTAKYWLVRIIISTEAIGILALAQNLYSALASLVPIKTVTFPIIAKNLQDKNLLQKLVQKVTKYTMVIYILMVISVFAIISPLIPYVFPKYAAAIPIFQLLSFKLLFNTFSISQAPLLFAYREQKIAFYIMGFNLFSVLILSAILMLQFGLIGTVIEALMTISIIFIIRELFLRKKYDLRTITFKSFFSIDETDRFVVRNIIENINTKIFRRKKYATNGVDSYQPKE